jgi:hypothetical protein
MRLATSGLAQSSTCYFVRFSNRPSGSSAQKIVSSNPHDGRALVPRPPSVADDPRRNISGPHAPDLLYSVRDPCLGVTPMRRREFIAFLGGNLAAWPLAARAQQRMLVIGFLGALSASTSSIWVAAFLRRLTELGWIEGHNIKIEYSWAGGRNDRLAEFADEFVRLKVDVIATHATAPSLAAKQATSVIPIVFATSGDPVGVGLVANLARPGGNVTGLPLQQGDTATKRLQLLRLLVDAGRARIVGAVKITNAKRVRAG